MTTVIKLMASQYQRRSSNSRQINNVSFPREESDAIPVKRNFRAFQPKPLLQHSSFITFKDLEDSPISRSSMKLTNTSGFKKNFQVSGKTLTLKRIDKISNEHLIKKKLVSDSFEFKIKEIEKEINKSLKQIDVFDRDSYILQVFRVYQNGFKKVLLINTACRNFFKAIESAYEGYIENILDRDRKNSNCSKSLITMQRTSEFHGKEYESCINELDEARKLICCLQDKEKQYIELLKIAQSKDFNVGGQIKAFLRRKTVKVPSIPAIKVPLHSLNPEFHEEFMSQFDEFSPSWREKIIH